MKIIYKDLKSGEIKVKIEKQDDLWYLSSIVEKGDIIFGKTERKIKIGKDEKTKSIKKVLNLTIRAEKIEWDSSASVLRINGPVLFGTEDVPKGSYHTIDVEVNDIVKITKEKWLSYQLIRLEEATKDVSLNILLVIFDRENAIFVLLKRYGYDILSTLEGEVPKKAFETKKKNVFFEEIVKEIKEYVKRYQITRVVLASPAFWKEEVLKLIDDKNLSRIIVTATCSGVGKNAVEEILRNDEVKKIIVQERIFREREIFDELMKEISKNGLSAYGFEEVKGNVEIGNIKHLLITDRFIKEKKERGSFEELDYLMKRVMELKGGISILNSEDDAGKRLDGIGGIAALLRYKN